MSQQTTFVTLSVSVSHRDHMRGSKFAKVTVVEYGDFECASSGQAYHAIKILLEEFGDRMRFVFRHFPLREFHPHVELASEAAEIAGAQNEFWQMHDLLFENQLHLKQKSLRQYAARLELDLARYDHEMSVHMYLQRVQEDIESGTKSRIRSTLAFFINGILHDVSFGLEDLQMAIETELRTYSDRKAQQ